MDREKVIEWLELCANGESCIGEKFMKCPFSPRRNAEQNCGVTMARNAIALLKEQGADIIAMSRFLESHGWDSDSICGKNVEIVVTNGDDDDA